MVRLLRKALGLSLRRAVEAEGAVFVPENGGLPGVQCAAIPPENPDPQKTRRGVSARSNLGQMIYWSAIGIAVIVLAAGIIAGFKGGEIGSLIVTTVFAIGAWLVGRAARDMLGKPGGE